MKLNSSGVIRHSFIMKMIMRQLNNRNANNMRPVRITDCTAVCSVSTELQVDRNHAHTPPFF